MSESRDTGPLVVSSKLLGHISEGLYRGPSGVLKELVSNSFDANATEIWISTGWPTFDVVSISDNGDGMSLRKFKRLVDGGIGDSEKRTGDGCLVNGRQVIGRLGIGLLGVSQISHEFAITSHMRESKCAFRAYVHMRDFRSEILDSESPTTLADDMNGEYEDDHLSVGRYEVTEVDYDDSQAGMTITAVRPTEGFRLQMAEGEPPPLARRFGLFVEQCGEKDVLATGPLYHRMIWQLASTIPVAYLPACPIPDSDDEMSRIATAIESYDFSVIVDGVKLYKPIDVSGQISSIGEATEVSGEGPFIFPLRYQKEVWGSKVSVRGYIYASAGTALHPDEMRGVMIRLRHVGIGEYDKSLLGYRYAEGPRFAWLTGELYVHSGLEDALTVGRDGFDSGHPHYIALRDWLHQELRSRVFPALYRSIKSRRQDRDRQRTSLRSQAFEEQIIEFAKTKMTIEEIYDKEAPPIVLDLERGLASINTAARWPRGKRQRETAQRLSIIYELVRQTMTDDDDLDAFVELTRQLLSQR